MNRHPDPNTPELPGIAMHFPAMVVPTGRADGAVLVIPGKPVQEDAEVTTAEAVKLLGRRYSRKHLQRLFRGTNRARRCKLMIPVRELEKLKARK